MTTEQLILQELQKLTGKVGQLEKELAQLEKRQHPHWIKSPEEQILGPIPIFNEELFEKAWEDYNPTVTPADKSDYETFGLKNNCLKCGLKFEGQTMGYVCPHTDCPNGMSPTAC